MEAQGSSQTTTAAGRWCRPLGSNQDVPFFKRAREPPLLGRRTGSAGWIRTTGLLGMNQARTTRLLYRAARSQPPVSNREGRAYEARPTCRVGWEDWSATRESNPTVTGISRSRALIRRTRSPELSPETLERPSGIEPAGSPWQGDAQPIAHWPRLVCVAGRMGADAQLQETPCSFAGRVSPHPATQA